VSEGLERDLARAGIAARVEVRDRLALLIPRDADASLTSEGQRRVALALAAAAGFTHVALELLD
jgi:hypothetical protein